MSPTIVILVLVSTFMHAGWNLLARRRRAGETAFFERMLLVSVAAGLIPMVVSESMARSLTPRAWGCVVAAGAFCGLYYLSLARAYRSSDFTVVYPVARALPVLLLAVGDVVLGRPPSAPGWLGMVLVAAGCLLAPLRSFRDFDSRRYMNSGSGWILLTALATVGYTLFDKAAADTIRSGPATAARYCYAFFFVSCATFLVLARVFGYRRQEPVRDVGWRGPALGAACNFGAYWLVLWVYQMTEQVSYVVAFRQFSIVVGVVAAFVIFREAGRAVRLTGTGLILAGLILIGLWGSSFPREGAGAIMRRSRTLGGSDMALSENERKTLLRLARESVAATVSDAAGPEAVVDGVLGERRGCFVTLTNKGRLRGCIGTFSPTGPLGEQIIEMAAAAARDPRFIYYDPVTADEVDALTVQVSVLSELEPIDDPLSIELGVHGIYITAGSASGCFLPEVATETGWSKEEFLSQCCAGKGGMSPDAWRDGTATVYVFTSEKFSDR